MSWFWRTPSILARSLMREVAPAGAMAASRQAATSAVVSVLVIPCSPRGSDRHYPLRTPCQARVRGYRAEMTSDFVSRAVSRAAWAGDALPGEAVFAGPFTAG